MLNTNIINNYLRTETQRLNYSKAEKLHTHQVGAIQGLAEYVNTVSVNEFVEQLYPVGSIYITENTELPESLQNNKSWEKFKTEDGKNYFKRVDSPLLNLFVEIIDESHNIISIDFGTINVPIMFENNKPTIGSSFAKEILEHISQKYIEVKNIEQDAFSYDDEKAIFRVTTSDLSEPETTVGYYKYNITSLGKSLETPQISVVDKSNDFASAEKVRPFLNFFNNKGVLTHVENISGLYQDCTALETIDISNWYTIHIKNISNMFNGCAGLTTVTGLDKIDFSEVSDMSGIFNGCTGLTGAFDLSFINIPAVTTIADMFNGCTGLTTITLPTNKLPMVKDCSNVFNGCEVLETINNLSSIITDTTETVAYMFAGCAAIVAIDFTGIDTSNVTAMDHMFDGCTKITFGSSINWDVNKVENCEYMFNGCKAITNLTNINLSFANTKTSEAMFAESGLNTVSSLSIINSPVNENISSMFADCVSLTTVSFNGANLSAVTDMSNIFKGCTVLNTVTLTGVDLSKVTDISNMFNGCSALTSVTLDGSTITKTAIGMFKEITGPLTTFSLVNVTIKDDAETESTSLEELFNEWTNIQSIDISGMVKSSVTTITDMIKGCAALTTITAHNEDFSGATGAFIGSGNSALETVDLSESTIKKETITSLNAVSFVGEDSLINISQCTFSSPATDTLANLFNNFSTVKNINMSNITVASSPLSIESAFSGCSAVKSIDITLPDSMTINTVTNAFSGCAALTSVKCTNNLYQTLNTALSSGPGGTWSWSDGVATKSG